MDLKSTKELFEILFVWLSTNPILHDVVVLSCLHLLILELFFFVTHGYWTAIMEYDQNWIEFLDDFGKKMGVNLVTGRFNKSIQTFSQQKLDGLAGSLWLCRVKLRQMTCFTFEPSKYNCWTLLIGYYRGLLVLMWRILYPSTNQQVFVGRCSLWKVEGNP